MWGIKHNYPTLCSVAIAKDVQCLCTHMKLHTVCEVLYKLIIYSVLFSNQINVICHIQKYIQIHLSENVEGIMASS